MQVNKTSICNEQCDASLLAEGKHFQPLLYSFGAGIKCPDYSTKDPDGYPACHDVKQSG